MPKKSVRWVTVNDLMQKKYRYALTEPVGKWSDDDFRPHLTPKQMLELGVFGGRYLRDCRKEFPKTWFAKAKFHPDGVPGHSPKLNYFNVDASQPLQEWKKKGWIHPDDPRGWFQWYCRFYLGRRNPKEDRRQIGRWKAIRRHIYQLQKNCRKGDLLCRPVQRQALLHWAYDSREL